MTPSYYDPSRCGTMFKSDTAQAAKEGRQFAIDNMIPAADNCGSEPNVILSIIDMQADFINPESSNLPGNLCVPGAVEDVENSASRRISVLLMGSVVVNRNTRSRSTCPCRRHDGIRLR